MKEIEESLELLDNLEYDMGQWILQHKDGLKEKLKILKRERSDLFPPSLYEVYLIQYEENAIEVIKNEISWAFNLDPENSLRINKDYVKLIAKDLLIP